MGVCRLWLTNGLLAAILVSPVLQEKIWLHKPLESLEVYLSLCPVRVRGHGVLDHLLQLILQCFQKNWQDGLQI